MSLDPAIADVLDDRSPWACVVSDAFALLDSLPADSVDLLVTSPPYEDARTYEKGRANGKVTRSGQDWVDWMVELVRQASPKVKGLIVINCEGRTEDYSYSATPFLLMADLKREGFNLRKPFVFNRVGIPGSGGPDWLRNDWEPIICITRPGRLPWSDNVACGHAPKWEPGGEMSHRMSDGTRVNQWGHSINSGATVVSPDGSIRSQGKRPSHVVTNGRDQFGGTPSATSGEGRKKNGSSKAKNALGVQTDRPVGTRKACGSKKDADRETYRERDNFREAEDGTVKGSHDRDIVAVANPGNVFNYVNALDAARNRIIGLERALSDAGLTLKDEPGDVLKIPVGGGLMGHDLAHENEAPFPLGLPEAMIRMFCPPNGVVCDPFSGSGTTLHAAVMLGRRFVGCDDRENQVAIAHRRARSVTPALFS